MPENTVSNVSFTINGKYIILGGGSAIYIWSVLSGKCEVKLIGHTDRVCSVAASFDGGLIVSGSDDKTVKVWEKWDKKPGLCV